MAGYGIKTFHVSLQTRGNVLKLRQNRKIGAPVSAKKAVTNEHGKLRNLINGSKLKKVHR